MSFKNSAATCALVAFTGCIQSDPGGPIADEPVGDEATASTEQELVLWRDGVNGILTLDGPWGAWTQLVYCNPGMYAVGYQARIEASQGGGLYYGHDDTSLNSVRLLCKHATNGATEWVSSHDGIWGDWKSPAQCPGTGNYLRSAQMRLESFQGGGNADDTAANDVQFGCTRSTGYVHAPGAHTWGDWGDWNQCPNNTAVCGLQIQFEGSQGGGVFDDTAMNGIRLHCCDLPCNNDRVCNGLETSATCPGDCGEAPPLTYCGDGACNGGESPYSCSTDCGPPPSYCGDGVCNGYETSYSCPYDCGGGGGCVIDPCGPQCPSAGSYACPAQEATIQ